MKDNRRPGQQVHLKSVDELLGITGEESSMEIEIQKIYGFRNHPFKVLDDERMEELVESVKINGILSPVLLRPGDHGKYEMISGHRRMHAAQLAGLTTIPAIIREMTDDEAVIVMVDANIQREELLPSEKAYALKMKMDALRHQGSCRHDGDMSASVAERKTAAQVGETSGMAARSVQRYIRLTELIPELLALVDSKRLQFTLGVEASYLDKPVQKWLYEYIRDNGVVKPEQISAFRKRAEEGSLNQIQMISVLNENLKGRLPARKVTIPEKKLNQFFPPNYSNADMEKVIFSLLKKWKESEADEDEI